MVIFFVNIRCAVSFRHFHKNIDTHTLHNIKYVLVFAAVLARLFLSGVAVQVQYVNFVKGLQQTLTHLAVYQSVNKTVVADIR